MIRNALRFKGILLLNFLIFGSLMLEGQTTTAKQLENKVDSIVQEGIIHQAYPGAQVYVSVKGVPIISKSYGFHTYDSIHPVRNSELYDLASITKVSSGLPILMKLLSTGQINLDEPLSKYLPAMINSNKSNLSLRNILAHQAGLESYIVYWPKAIKKNGKYYRKTFKRKQKKRYPIKISEQLFLHRKYKQVMLQAIKDSPVNRNPRYKYSGLFFQLLPELIENITKQDFETYLQDEIYSPIGISKMVYKPADKFPLDEIVPTEYDSLFRKQLVHGTVHDEAAAMLDGISCNAGLFSNAGDLAKLFQLYLDDGIYKGKSVLDSAAIHKFTQCQFCPIGNRRGLGFDKPLINYIPGKSHVAEGVSPESFGHSGFTGTFVWADPIGDILVIFLSNRVYPSRKNRELFRRDIRPRIQAAVYEFYGN